MKNKTSSSGWDGILGGNVLQWQCGKIPYPKGAGVRDLGGGGGHGQSLKLKKSESGEVYALHQN